MSIVQSSKAKASQGTAAAAIIVEVSTKGIHPGGETNRDTAAWGVTTALGSPVLPDVQNTMAGDLASKAISGSAESILDRFFSSMEKKSLNFTLLAGRSNTASSI